MPEPSVHHTRREHRSCHRDRRFVTPTVIISTVARCLAAALLTAAALAAPLLMSPTAHADSPEAIG